MKDLDGNQIDSPAILLLVPFNGTAFHSVRVLVVRAVTERPNRAEEQLVAVSDPVVLSLGRAFHVVVAESSALS